MTDDIDHDPPRQPEKPKKVRDRIAYNNRRDESIAVYITQCDDALRAALEQTNGQWPDSLTLPLWPSRVERSALTHWLDELAAKSGKRIRIEFDPPLFDYVGSNMG